MIEIDDKIVSREIFDKKFVCDLTKCKGACCVEGDSGAPLEEDELSILDDVFEDIKPYLTEEGIVAIKTKGKYEKDWDSEYVTTLIKEGGACAYISYDNNGTAKCGIEQAYNDGVIDFIKPISCHLYPIRIKKYSSFVAVNYNEWSICKDACSLGEELNVKVYKFLKAPIIRKFGVDFFEKLNLVDNEINSI